MIQHSNNDPGRMARENANTGPQLETILELQGRTNYLVTVCHFSDWMEVDSLPDTLEYRDQMHKSPFLSSWNS